jgi:hypothetical protein
MTEEVSPGTRGQTFPTIQKKMTVHLVLPVSWLAGKLKNRGHHLPLDQCS